MDEPLDDRVIDIKPYGWGWKVFEAPGVEPVFPPENQAIHDAENRADFRTGFAAWSVATEHCFSPFSSFVETTKLPSKYDTIPPSASYHE
jgi:hypothetical protein